MGRIALLGLLGAIAVANFVRALFSGVRDHWTPFVRPGYTNFGDYYLYARVGLHAGWNRLYDAAAQVHEWQAMGGLRTNPFYLMIYPPPMAWLVAPLTVLPLGPAAAIWGVLMLALFVATWSLSAPGDRWQRRMHLAMSLGLFPVVYALLQEQVVLLVMFSVVLAWWLLNRRHDTLAGLVLLLVLVRPQVMLLVPLTLLIVGRRRSVVVFAIGSAVIGGIAALTLGADGLHQYLDRLALAASGAPQFVSVPGGSVPAMLPHGLPRLAGELMVALLCARAAWVSRRQGLEVPIAAGLVGSILATPYLHVQDFTVLVVAAWLFLRSGPPQRDRYLLLTGYGLLLLKSFVEVPVLVPVLTLSQVLLEAVWLLAMARWLPEIGRAVPARPAVQAA